MNLRNLDLNLLRIFHSVYVTRSNTETANTLGLTQPAISNALRRLRDHLSDPLFVRKGSDYTPTPEADRLAPVVSEILKSLERTLGGAADTFDPCTSARTFILAIPDALEPLVLPGLANIIQSGNLGVKFRIQPIFGFDLKSELISGDLDLALLPHATHYTGLTSVYLRDEVACIIARPDHPLFGHKSEFTLHDLATAELVGLEETVRRITNLEQEVRSQKIERNFVCLVNRMWSIPHIVSTTDLVGAVSRTMADSLADTYGFKIFDMPIRRPAHHWHMTWSETREQDLGHAWFRTQIGDLVEHPDTPAPQAFN
ncbi:MAG: LysR family transcriptional regulator [Labrenzia sp.]